MISLFHIQIEPKRILEKRSYLKKQKRFSLLK